MLMLLISLLATAVFAQPAVTFHPIPVTVAAPAGWKVAAHEDNNAVLIPAVNPMSTIMVHTGIYDNIDALGTAMGAAVKDLKFSSGPRIVGSPEERNLGGRQGFALTFAGESPDGGEVFVYVYGSLQRDVALGVMAVAPAGQHLAVKASADDLIRTAKLGAFSFDARAAAPFAGRWAKSRAQGSGNSNTAAGGWSDSSAVYYTFAPSGAYQYSSQSVTTITGGGSTVFSNNNEEDSGRYFVFGNKILFTSQKSGSRMVRFTLAGARMQLGDIILIRVQ
jgi:hypothetical protein